MQSFLQYRRLRRDVQEDLARASGQKGERPSGSSASTSTDTPIPPISELLPAEKTAHEAAAAPSADTPLVPGVTVSRPDESDGSVIFIVGWKENDPNNPLEWTMLRKWITLVTCCLLAITLTLTTSVEGPTLDAFDEHFGVNPMAGSVITGRILNYSVYHYLLTLIIAGIMLIGVGVGSLFSGPFSETFGRNLVYFTSMILVILFIMAKALAPNYGAALAFRFLCGLFVATPMTVAGGTVGDVLSPMQIPWGLPFMTFCSYSGPILGPVIGAFTPEIGFAWADWITMILNGAALIFVLLAQSETYSPVLLEWRAKHLRDLTGDTRYRAEHASTSSLGTRLLTNVSRPLTMVWTEPIILIFSFYLILLYFVLFTFLGGYSYIFTATYGVSNGITFTIWSAMLPGIVIAAAMIPFIYHLVKKAAAKAAAAGQPLQPEVSLYYSMAGASFLMPISLFWMAWTCYVSNHKSMPPYFCAYTKTHRAISVSGHPSWPQASLATLWSASSLQLICTLSLCTYSTRPRLWAS